jgi:hypothetical protein
MEKPSKTELLVEALEYYIYRLKRDNANQVAINTYTQLLKEIDVDNYSTIDYD